MSGVSDSKILRVGLLNEVHHLDPQSANDNESMWVLRQVLEMPYEFRAGHAEVEPVLFEGPLESLDGGRNQRYRGKVRKDVRFADGEPVTPAHVVRCLGQASLSKEQATVTQDGDHLIFDLHRANARFDVMLSHQQCAVYRLEGGRVCATGPFQISPDSTPGHLRLVRNPHYRQELKLDEIHFKVYPVDGNGRATALVRAIQEGEVDFCSVLPRDDISRLSGVRKSFLPGISTAILSMNCARPPLDDPHLRRALAQAVNRLKVAESCYSNGLAFTATSILPRGLVPVDDGLAYDLRKARASLERAGKPLPEKLSGLMTWGPRPYLPHPTAAAEVISRHLAELGVTVEWTRPATSSDFFQRCIDGTHDLVLAGWVSDTVDPCDFLEASLSSQRVPTWENLAVSTNHAHYRSPRMDEKLAQYRAQGDMGTLQEVMEVLTEEAPLVPLIYGASASVLSFKVLGFQPSPLGTQKLVHLDLKR